MGPAARSPVADAASDSELFGLHSTQGRPNKEYVDLRVSGWEAGEVIRARAGMRSAQPVADIVSLVPAGQQVLFRAEPWTATRSLRRSLHRADLSVVRTEGVCFERSTR
jgi:hypothetical protein